MADTVNAQIYDGARNLVLMLNSFSDATGESLVRKLDVTTLKPNPGTHLVLWRATCAVDAPSTANVVLWWEGTPNKIMLVAGGHPNEYDFERFGGVRNDAVLATGNVLLSTAGFLANNSYSLLLEFKKGGITGQNV